MKTPTVDQPHQVQSHPDVGDANTFARIGGITRDLHEALRVLGAAPELQKVVQEIPDARDRLAYVGEMTETAAHQVLGLIEAAKPECDALFGESLRLSERIRPAFDVCGSADETRHLLEACADFTIRVSANARSQGETLSKIMMTQGFQDLSGQVIKKVIDIITRTERQLVQLLIDHPLGDGSSSDVATQGLQGPQTPDKALQQDDVDDLLASLGF